MKPGTKEQAEEQPYDVFYYTLLKVMDSKKEGQ